MACGGVSNSIYILSPHGQRPENEPLKAIAFVDWKHKQESELNSWKEELADLGGLSIDWQLVLNNVKERLMRLLEAEAREAGLLPRKQIRDTPVGDYSNTVSRDSGRWMTFVQLSEWGNKDPTKGASITPWHLQVPRWEGLSINYWIDLILQTAEWLIRGRSFAFGYVNSNSLPRLGQRLQDVQQKLDLVDPPTYHIGTQENLAGVKEAV